MEHLACFFPGNLALGVMSGAVSGKETSLLLESSSDDDLDGGDGELEKALVEKEKAYLAVADALAEMCALAGEATATGLAPEVVLFLPEARPGHPFSLLRPCVSFWGGRGGVAVGGGEGRKGLSTLKRKEEKRKKTHSTSRPRLAKNKSNIKQRGRRVIFLPLEGHQGPQMAPSRLEDFRGPGEARQGHERRVFWDQGHLSGASISRRLAAVVAFS